MPAAPRAGQAEATSPPVAGTQPLGASLAASNGCTLAGNWSWAESGPSPGTLPWDTGIYVSIAIAVPHAHWFTPLCFSLPGINLANGTRTCAQAKAARTQGWLLGGGD